VNSTLLTWTLCEELRLRGHHVDYGKLQPEHYKGVKYDWIHGAGQDSWEALNFARVIGAKCHIHLEGVAHWRIGYETATSWGYDREHTSQVIDMFTTQYKQWMSAAFKADSCTVNGDKQVKMIEWMFGKKLPNCHTICCGVDARYALSLPEFPRQNYMVTLSRLEPNKHIMFIAESLVILKKRGFDVPQWVIVGYGTQEQTQRLVNFCEENTIVIGLRPCFGAEKWLWIKKAKLMLCGLMMWIPISEGIVCKTPVLAIDDPEVLVMYKDTVWWAERNNPEHYAEMIEVLLDPKQSDNIKFKTDSAIERLIRGELYANTQSRAAEQYSDIFMEKIKPYQK
jgi:glycosyltransferase involved in cell wall biosynthesis